MIKFLGIFPTSQEVNGKWFFDFEGEALFEFSIPKICKLQLKGKTKNIIQKRKQYRVVASRTDDMAQWIFLKHWLESGQQLGMKIFCSVPKDLEENKRYVICDALVSQKGRKIQALNHAQVLMK